MEAAIDTPTPVSTPETSSPAPSAIASPSPAPITSQRPTNSDELSSWMRSHATDPEPPVVAPEASAATAQPTSTDPTVPAVNPSAKQGPIPFEVHKKTLDNAYGERDAARAEVQQTQGKLAELLKIPQAELAEVVQSAKQMGSDPMGHTFGMLRHLLADPKFGPQVRSELARAFGGLRQAAPAPQEAQPEAEPQPDRQIVDEHNQVIGMAFSDGGRAHTEWLRSQMKAEFDKTLQPFVQEREQTQAQAKAAETQKQIDARTNDLISDISEVLEIGADTAPEQRDTLFKAVNALMAADPKLSVHKAAMQVRKSHVVPQQKASATRDALDTIHKKAAGNTAGNSGSATPIKRPTNEAELAAYMRSLDH